MYFVCYQAHEDTMMRSWLCFALVMLKLIPYIGCVFFWIYNSCKLIEISFNAMILQKFIKLSKFFNHSWNSVHSINLTNFDFYDYHLFAILKGQKYH